jgi:hypothetical protein
MSHLPSVEIAFDQVVSMTRDRQQQVRLITEKW